jgi:hypothetical protein
MCNRPAQQTAWYIWATFLLGGGTLMVACALAALTPQHVNDCNQAAGSDTDWGRTCSFYATAVATATDNSTGAAIGLAIFTIAMALMLHADVTGRCFPHFAWPGKADPMGMGRESAAAIPPPTGAAAPLMSDRTDLTATSYTVCASKFAAVLVAVFAEITAMGLIFRPTVNILWAFAVTPYGDLNNYGLYALHAICGVIIIGLCVMAVAGVMLACTIICCRPDPSIYARHTGGGLTQGMGVPGEAKM